MTADAPSIARPGLVYFAKDQGQRLRAVGKAGVGDRADRGSGHGD